MRLSYISLIVLYPLDSFQSPRINKRISLRILEIIQDSWGEWGWSLLLCYKYEVGMMNRSKSWLPCTSTPEEGSSLFLSRFSFVVSRKLVLSCSVVSCLALFPPSFSWIPDGTVSTSPNSGSVTFTFSLSPEIWVSLFIILLITSTNQKTCLLCPPQESRGREVRHRARTIPKPRPVLFSHSRLFRIFNFHISLWKDERKSWSAGTTIMLSILANKDPKYKPQLSKLGWVA